MNPLQLLAGGVLLFGLPGFTFLKAVFPSTRLAAGAWHNAALAAGSVLMSVTVVILVGAGLGFLGAFTPAALATALVAWSVAFGATGIARGAYRRRTRLRMDEPQIDREDLALLDEAVHSRATAEEAAGSARRLRRQKRGSEDLRRLDRDAEAAREWARQAEGRASAKHYGSAPPREKTDGRPKKPARVRR